MTALAERLQTEIQAYVDAQVLLPVPLEIWHAPGGRQVCFSAQASFTTSAVLIPLGIYTIQRARCENPSFQLLSAFPLIFGVQQFFEGLVWQVVGQDVPVQGSSSAIAYLFFAYFIWPLVVPLAAYYVESAAWRRRLFLLFSVIGGIYGALLFFPLLINENWLAFRLERGSILYEPILIFDGWIPRDMVRLIYALLVAIPLMLSSVLSVRFFGIIILTSVIISAVVFEYAFVSIWCFFAAILSLYIVYMITHVFPKQSKLA